MRYIIDLDYEHGIARVFADGDFPNILATAPLPTAATAFAALGIAVSADLNEKGITTEVD